jgi:hypothetical protein
VHGIPTQGLLDLGVLVQMARPDRLGPFREVSRVCAMSSDRGEPRVRDIYTRDRDHVLRRVAEWEKLDTPGVGGLEHFVQAVLRTRQRLAEERR